jgi:GNAT superfamily N-acetyltransferase
MSQAFLIRQLSAHDELAGATDLLMRFFREEGFDTPDDVITRNTRTLASLQECGLFVAEAKGETVGVATVSLDFGIEFGWSAEMGDLYVVPEWRGKGMSRALVDAIERFLKLKGVSSYRVTVTSFAEEHHALTKYYALLGFHAEGRKELSKHLDVQP